MPIPTGFDIVYPIKLEEDEGFPDYSEVQSSEDFLASAGIILQDDDHYINVTDDEISFTDPINGTVKVSELGGGSGDIEIRDNGTTIGDFDTINFIGFNITDQTSYVDIEVDISNCKIDGGWLDSNQVPACDVDGGSL